jgi:hypothetical protein
MLTKYNRTSTYLKLAYQRIRKNNDIKFTNLEYNETLSKLYGNHIYLHLCEI